MGHKLTKSDWVMGSTAWWQGLPGTENILKPLFLEDGSRIETAQQGLSIYGENPVKSQPLFTMPQELTYEVYAAALSDGRKAIKLLNEFRQVSGHKAICRDGDGKIHQISTETYSECQFSQLANVADFILSKGEHELETLGTCDDGGQMFITLKRNQDFAIGNDRSKVYTNLMTSHTSKIANKIAESVVRIVCANTCGFFDREESKGKLSWRHSGDMDRKIENAKAAYEYSQELRKRNFELWEKMSEISLDDIEFQAIFHDYWQNRGFSDVDSEGQELIEKVNSGLAASDADQKLARTLELRKERKHDAFKIFRSKIKEEAEKLETTENCWLAMNALNNYSDNRTESRRNRPKISKLLDAATSGHDAIASGSVQKVANLTF